MSGQSFPYTTIANPKRFIPNLTFGIKDSELQELVNYIKNKEDPSIIVLLSHTELTLIKKWHQKSVV